MGTYRIMRQIGVTIITVVPAIKREKKKSNPLEFEQDTEITLIRK